MSPAGTYSFAVTSGALPNGLALNAATGVISGTPTQGGAYSFRRTATLDSCAGFRDYTLTIGCAALAAAAAGVTYSASVAAAPAGTYTYSLMAGNLPSTNGISTFSVAATGCGACASAPQSFTIAIGGGGCPTITLPNIAATGSVGLL